MSKWIYMVRFGDFCTVKEAHQEKNWIVVTSKNVAMFKISTNQTKIHQFSFIGVIKDVNCYYTLTFRVSE